LKSCRNLTYLPGRSREDYGAKFLSPDEVAEQMPLYFAAINEANTMASIAE
jgi:hypothetical protein